MTAPGRPLWALGWTGGTVARVPPTCDGCRREIPPGRGVHRHPAHGALCWPCARAAIRRAAGKAPR